MPIDEILSAMIEERDKLDRAIEILNPNGSRRSAMTTRQGNKGGAATGRSRRGMSASARKAQSERMRAYWAAKRKKAGAASSKKS